MLLLRSLSISGFILLTHLTLAGCAGNSATLQNNQDDTLTSTGVADIAVDETLNISIQEGFITTGEMDTARRHRHTATLLPNGKVLITGGRNNDETLRSALLFDPKGNNGKGTFTATGDMNDPRHFHTATLLPNGKVMIAGGNNDSGTINSVEIFDPAGNRGKGTFTKLENTLIERRHFHTATLLPNGKVLFAGGWDRVEPQHFLPNAELFDPNDRNGQGSSRNLGRMASVHFGHTATLLPNGKVLIAGGISSLGVTDIAELFDPEANDGQGSFSSTGKLNTPSFEHTATLLPNGKVLILGGEKGSVGFFNRAELYDPADNNGAGSFTTIGNMNVARSGHKASLLKNGQVLITGGLIRKNMTTVFFDSAEIYNPKGNNGAGSFIVIDKMIKSRHRHTSTLLANGQVLIAGGDSENDTIKNAELYTY